MISDRTSGPAPGLEPSTWISPASEAPQAYFRKEFFVTGEVESSWVALAATDEYDLYVNGQSVGEGSFVSTSVSALYDITQLVHAGTNVIAVSSHRQTYPGSPRVAVRLVVRDPSGRERAVPSDRTWKSSVREEWANHGVTVWYSVEYLADQWSNSMEAGPVEDADVYPLEADPEPVTRPMKGQWIMDAGAGRTSAYFEKKVSLPSWSNRGWFRVTATGPYDFYINGNKVASGIASPTSLNLYELTPALKKGINRFGVGVQNDLGRPRIIADGIIHAGPAGEIDLRTDSGWSVVRTDSGEARSGRRTSGEKSDGTAAVDWSMNRGSFGKTSAELDLPIGLRYKTYLSLAAFILSGMVLSMMVWLGYGSFLKSRLPENWTPAFSRMPVLFLPSVIALAYLLLMQFDIRYDPSYPFQKWALLLAAGLAVFTVGLYTVDLAAGDRRGPESKRGLFPGWSGMAAQISRRGNLIWSVSVAVLVLAGLAYRLHGLSDQSLTHDEVGMIEYVQKLFGGSYPFKKIGIMEKPLTTYELLPYPIALSVALFGWSDAALRVPAVVFGAFTILLIALAGREMFNRRVGLLAAAICAFTPWSVVWSQNLFYPQQAQFFSLLTVYLFYKAVRGKPLSAVYFYLAAASFICNYLSWEGTAFLLPALTLALIAYKENDFSWLKEKCVWISVAAIGLVVFVQYNLRIQSQSKYLSIGTGQGEVQLDPFFIMDSMFNPYFYLKSFYWFESHAVLTMFVVAGLLLILRSRPLRFLYVLLFSVSFAATCFLPAYANRYLYYAQPFLILSGTAVCVLFMQILSEDGPSGGRSARLSMRVVRGAAFIAAAVILFLSSNALVFKLYRMSEDSRIPAPLTRLGVYYIDYRSSVDFLKKVYKPSDAIVAAMPHIILYYANLDSDYQFNVELGSKSYFDPGTLPPRFVDRYAGNPVMRDSDETQSALLGHSRVWIVAAPFEGFLRINDADLLAYLQANTRVVFESYNSRIYLWEK